MTAGRARHHAWCVRGGLLAILLALPMSLHADAYDAVLARAVAAKERALEINDPPHWEEALRLFGQADRIRSTKESKYELAVAAAQMHAFDLAVESYQAALDLGIAGTARTHAESFLAEQAPKMGRLEVLGPSGTTILLRDQERGTLPLPRPVVVFAGEVEIEAFRADEPHEMIRLTVRPGTLEIVRLGETRFSKTATTASAAVPSTNSSATGAPVRAAASDRPAAPADLISAGLNSAAPTSAGRPPSLSPKTGHDGSSLTSIPAPPLGSSRAPSGGVPVWPFIASGVALMAAGGIAVVLSPPNLANARSDLHAMCTEMYPDGEYCRSAPPASKQQVQDAQDAIATWKFVSTLGWIGVGTGAASAALGVVLYLSSSPNKSSRSGGTHPASPAIPSLAAIRGGGMLVYGASF